MATLLEQHQKTMTLGGKHVVVRRGYLPEREVVAATGPLPVKAPQVRVRSCCSTRFKSNVVPPYVRKLLHASAALPRLCLRGVSNGTISEALGVLLRRLATVFFVERGQLGFAFRRRQDRASRARPSFQKGPPGDRKHADSAIACYGVVA